MARPTRFGGRSVTGAASHRRVASVCPTCGLRLPTGRRWVCAHRGERAEDCDVVASRPAWEQGEGGVKEAGGPSGPCRLPIPFLVTCADVPVAGGMRAGQGCGGIGTVSGGSASSATRRPSGSVLFAFAEPVEGSRGTFGVGREAIARRPSSRATGRQWYMPRCGNGAADQPGDIRR